MGRDDDIIGIRSYLSQSEFILLLWHLPRFDFPLNKALTELVEANEEMLIAPLHPLATYCDLTPSERKWLISTTDQIVPSNTPCDETNLSLELSLFSGTSKLQNFSFFDISIFKRETRAVLIELMAHLLESMIFVRSDSLASTGRNLDSTRDDARNTLAAVLKVSPDADSDALIIREVISRTLALDTIQKGLANVGGNDPFRRVISELALA